MFKYFSKLFQTCYPRMCRDPPKQLFDEWVWWESMCSCVYSTLSPPVKYRCVTQIQRNFPITQSTRLRAFWLFPCVNDGKWETSMFGDIHIYSQAINLFHISPGQLQNFLPFLVSNKSKLLLIYAWGLQMIRVETDHMHACVLKSMYPYMLMTNYYRNNVIF